MVRIHWGSFEKGFLDWRALTIFSKARQSLRVSDGLCSSHFTLALDHLQQIDERTFDDLKGEFNCQRGCPSLYCASFLVRKWVSCSFEEVFCFSVYLSTISWENEGAEGCLPIAKNIIVIFVVLGSCGSFEGCAWSDGIVFAMICESAAKGGHLEALKRARENGCKNWKLKFFFFTVNFFNFWAL